MIWIMTIKDFKRMLRDRKALMITLLMPAILTAILGFSLGGSFSGEIQLDRAEVAVVSNANIEADEEKLREFFEQGLMQLSMSETEADEVIQQVIEVNFEQIFLEEVLNNEVIQPFIQYEEMTKEQAQQKLDDGVLTSIIIIPEHFHYNMWLSFFTPFRNDVEIRIQKGSNHQLKASIVEQIVKGYTDHLSVGIIAKQVLLEKSAEFNVGDLVYNELGNFMESLMTIELNETAIESASVAGKESITSFHYYAAGMGVMFMLFSAAYAASYCVNERFILTYSRMKMAGISNFTVLSGRFLSSSVFVFFQLAFLMVFSKLLFQISWGSLVVIFALTMAASLAVASLAVFLSAINLIVANDRMSEVFQSAILPLMALVGGSFVPNSNLPSILKIIGDQTINGATLNGYLMAMQGYSLSDVQGQLAVLIIYSLGFVFVTAVTLKLKEVSV